MLLRLDSVLDRAQVAEVRRIVEAANWPGEGRRHSWLDFGSCRWPLPERNGSSSYATPTHHAGGSASSRSVRLNRDSRG